MAGVVISLGVFGALAWQRLDRSSRQTAAATDATATSIGTDAASIEQAIQSANGRPVYKYSVVPGGVRSPEEMLEAMARDKVVKDHYAGMDATTVRVERLVKPITAHVSYRIADRVYWTKKQVTIPAGEKVLTDGKRMLRCRCGNGISVDPLEPTLDAEPETGSFDALVAPLSAKQAPLDPKLSYYTPPHLAGRGVPTPSSSIISNPPGNPPYGVPPGGLPPGRNPPGGNPPGNPPPGDPPTTTPPPPGYPPPGDPPPGDPPPGDPPPGDPPPPRNPPPGDPPPPPPTPVPEPGTGLLIASGAGWLLARRLRKQQNKRKAAEPAAQGK